MVNDEPRALGDGATVADLVSALGLGPRRIAVEVNLAIVPRTEYERTLLRGPPRQRAPHRAREAARAEREAGTDVGLRPGLTRTSLLGAKADISTLC